MDRANRGARHLRTQNMDRRTMGEIDEVNRPMEGVNAGRGAFAAESQTK